MAWIYRYTDIADNIIKYVGIVWGKNRTLIQRVIEHKKNDEWCRTRNWKIEYITNGIDTRSEADAFESHYISLYNTSKYFNIAKDNYGVNKYLPDRENDWILFDQDDELLKYRTLLNEQILDLIKMKEYLENCVANLGYMLDNPEKYREIDRDNMGVKEPYYHNENKPSFIDIEKKYFFDEEYANSKISIDNVYIIHVIGNTVSCNYGRLSYGIRTKKICDKNAIRSTTVNNDIVNKTTRYYWKFWGNSLEEAYKIFFEVLNKIIDINQKFIEKMTLCEDDGTFKYYGYMVDKYGTYENYKNLTIKKHEDNIRILKGIINDGMRLKNKSVC